MQPLGNFKRILKKFFLQDVEPQALTALPGTSQVVFTITEHSTHVSKHDTRLSAQCLWSRGPPFSCGHRDFQSSRKMGSKWGNMSMISDFTSAAQSHRIIKAPTQKANSLQSLLLVVLLSSITLLFGPPPYPQWNAF